MAGNKSKNLPSFKSVDELVVFFDSHDMGEYWEQLPEAEVQVSLARRNASSSNTGKRWTPAQLKQLRQLAKQNTPTRVIGQKLGRTENAVRTKASEKGVSLKLKNSRRITEAKGNS